MRIPVKKCTQETLEKGNDGIASHKFQILDRLISANVNPGKIRFLTDVKLCVFRQ
jgi:hypothetical protein